MLALSDTGDVYAWGGGGSGQLGLGRKKSYPSPQLVWGMMRKGVRQVGAGDYHSAALTHSGRLQMPLTRHRPCRHPLLLGPIRWLRASLGALETSPRRVDAGGRGAAALR